MVLVGSLAFAGISGSASVDFGYDLDTSDYGFSNSDSVSVDVNIVEALGSAAGEGDIYADIAGTFTLDFSNADAGTLNASDEVIVGFDLDHATVVGADWSVGITGVADAADWAVSALNSSDIAQGTNDLGYAIDDASTAWTLSANDFLTTAAGVSVTYADYAVSFGLTGNADAGTYGMYGTLATPDFDLADGMTAAFAVAGSMTDTDKAAAGSVKVAYADDMISADVAADMVYDAAFMADIAAAIAYDMVSVDVYFATDAYCDGTAQGISNLLAAQAVVDLDPLTVTVSGADIINDLDLGLTVAYVVSDELSVSVNGGYVVDGASIDFGADVTYTAADYTATAGFGYDVDSAKVALNASVESTTLIDGATLSLSYAGDDVTEVDAATEDNGNLGSITASVEIAF